MCHFTRFFFTVTQRVSVAYIVRQLRWCNIQLYTSARNSIVVTLFWYVIRRGKKRDREKKMKECLLLKFISTIYNGTKRMRSEIRSNWRFSARSNGNYQLFCLSNVLVVFFRLTIYDEDDIGNDKKRRRKKNKKRDLTMRNMFLNEWQKLKENFSLPLIGQMFMSRQKQQFLVNTKCV